MTRTAALLALMALSGCASIPIAAGVLTLGAAGVNVGVRVLDIVACKRHDEAGCAAPQPVLVICGAVPVAPCLWVRTPIASAGTAG